MPRTPYPWAQSDSQPKLVFADNQGMIHFEKPVAKFHNVEDATAACTVSLIVSDMLGTLRAVLPLLEHEAKQRQASGIAEYMAVADKAVARVKATIAKAEGWST